jgi:hypothetical protein
VLGVGLGGVLGVTQGGGRHLRAPRDGNVGLDGGVRDDKLRLGAPGGVGGVVGKGVAFI